MDETLENALVTAVDQISRNKNN
uniref:Uncharacterized protein n=1 Tax=Arundo donax TaxID=35708 RepID=A0A0A9HLJ3_ARUDO